MASVVLVDRLVHLLKANCLLMSNAQLRNVAMLCVALAMGSGSQLGSLALRLPVPGRQDSLIQRIRRQLRRAPRWDKAFAPIVRRLLAEWTGVEIPLVMDRTDLGHCCSILTVGVAYGGRVLPLAPKSRAPSRKRCSPLCQGRGIQPHLWPGRTTRRPLTGTAGLRCVG